MIIITDRSRLLNLNHFAIYMMVKPDEIVRYGDKLEGLNRYSTVTKGIFQFYIVEKGNTPYEKLPEEMIRNMRHFNVMVRLVNTIRFTYCYGIELIDLETGIHSIVEQLKVFVENVCNEDIVHLDILSQRNTITSRAAIKYYRDNNIVKEMFEAALNGENADKTEGKLLLQKTSNTTDIGTSYEIAKSAADSDKEKLESKIEKERRERERPKNTPNITMTVKMVKTGKERKDGSLKKKIGVELNIDGNIIPLSFVSTDQTFLYIINLMAIKEDRYIERSRFLPLELEKKYREKNILVLQHRDRLISWLHNRYRALNFSKDFEAWYDVVKKNPQRLDNAISGIKRTLWETLEDEFKDAYYYCVIYNDDGIYKIRIDKEKIGIDPEIMEQILRNEA